MVMQITTELTRKRPRFNLGHTGITQGASAVLDAADVARAIFRHARGDWGEGLPESDQQENERAVKLGFRILSQYESGGTRFWIITEADRSSTTVLLPEEY